MNLCKKIQSYIFPISVVKTDSPYNPFLEVVLVNGNYSLNSENTNYSNGSLYSVFEKVFKKLNPDWSRINKALILGYGAGSIAEIIMKHQSGCSITGVEIDEKVIQLAKDYFKLDNFKNVHIHCSSAKDYMDNCREMFDLIIIDLFIDKIVPEEAETDHFLHQIKQSLAPGGCVIFNKVTYTKQIKEQIPIVAERYRSVFGNFNLLTVMKTGKIFISFNDVKQ